MFTRALRQALKWYLKDVMCHPLTLAVLALTVAGQYVSVAWYRGEATFAVVSEQVLLPLYLLTVAVAVSRNQTVTIYEIELFRNWKVVYWGRVLASAAALAPVFLADAAMLHLYGKDQLMYAVLARYATYVMLAALTTMARSQATAAAMAIALAFMTPPTVAVVASTAQYHAQRIDAATAALLYVFAPLTMHLYIGIADLSEQVASSAACLVSLAAVLVVQVVFHRQQLKP